jgi:gas vesicle protein
LAAEINIKENEVVHMKAKSLLLGFLVGGAAAGIATLLSAPDSGKVTRRQLKAHKDVYTAELKELKESLMQIKESVATATKEGKTVLGEFVHDIKLSLYEWKLSTDENKTALQKEVKEIEQSIQELEKDLSPDDKA